MSDTIIGFERYSIGTPVKLRRGSDSILRRTCYVTDWDAGAESVLDISAATAITWHLVTTFKRATAATLAKTLVSGIALVGGGTGGQLDITINASDTKALGPGQYWGGLSVVIGTKRYKFRSYRVHLQAAPDLGE